MRRRSRRCSATTRRTRTRSAASRAGEPRWIRRVGEVLSAWPGARLALKVRKVRVLKPDVALVEADAELTGWKKLPPGFRAEDGTTVRSRLLQVFQKEAGAWRVAASYEVDVKTKLELPPVPEERSIRGR